jgi:hypothetical protein
MDFRIMRLRIMHSGIMDIGTMDLIFVRVDSEDLDG